MDKIWFPRSEHSLRRQFDDIYGLLSPRNAHHAAKRPSNHQPISSSLLNRSYWQFVFTYSRCDTAYPFDKKQRIPLMLFLKPSEGRKITTCKGYKTVMTHNLQSRYRSLENVSVFSTLEVEGIFWELLWTKIRKPNCSENNKKKPKKFQTKPPPFGIAKIDFPLI